MGGRPPRPKSAESTRPGSGCCRWMRRWDLPALDKRTVSTSALLIHGRGVRKGDQAREATCGGLADPVLPERPLSVAMGISPAPGDGRLAGPPSSAGPEPERFGPTSAVLLPSIRIRGAPATTVVSLTTSAPTSALNRDCYPHGHGFIAETSMKFAGNDSEPRARLIVTM